MSKKDNQDTMYEALKSMLGNQRAVETDVKFEKPKDFDHAVLQSINSSIVETEKLIKDNCGLNTDDIVERLSSFPKESQG